jgi:hypothetical protein
MVARLLDRPAKHNTGSSSSDGGSAFAAIDAAHLKRASNDPTIRRFAELADRYYSVLRRKGRAPRP